MMKVFLEAQTLPSIVLNGIQKAEENTAWKEKRTIDATNRIDKRQTPFTLGIDIKPSDPWQ